MTTIAYRDGIMASDSAVTYNGLIEARVNKCEKLFNGKIVGVAGSPSHFIQFLRFVVSGSYSDRPALRDDDLFFAVVVFVDPEQNRQITIYDRNLEEIYIDEKFIAIGSGREIALGAMAAGTTAERAVEIACEYDTHTAGPITIISLDGDQ